MTVAVTVLQQSSFAPHVPKGVVEFTFTFDSAYVSGGHSVAAYLPKGAKCIAGNAVPMYAATTLRWAKVVNDSGTPKVRAYADDHGALGAQVAGSTDLTGYSVTLSCSYE